MKIFLVSNTAWSLINFRRGLILELKAKGHEPILLAPADKNIERIKTELDVRFIPLVMDNKGKNPLKDLLLLFRCWRLFRSEKPDLVINYTIKPVVYGALAATWQGTPVISVITGLGTVFVKENLVTKLVEGLYKLSQRRVKKLFFLNQDDFSVFKNRDLAKESQMIVLPGEGVDTAYFSPQAAGDRKEGRIQFLLMARMLWDKGVGEYVQAARLIKQQFDQAQFALLGFLDVENATAISRQQVEQWVQEGVVSYLGVSNDVRPYINNTDCVVLPSYREGVSRSLLEAASMAKPIITTDAVGCRDVVDDGENGYLCRIKDAEHLAEKMIQFIRLSRDEKTAMGNRGRKKIENTFDERLVFGYYFNVIDQIINEKK